MSDDFRVLLVDDEEELVTTLAERLEIRGISAVAVTRARDALTLVADSCFEVVLLDVKMPSLSGLELLRLIRQQCPATQVILITGHGSTEEGEIGLRGGAFDYVVKPVDIDVLVRKMRDAASISRSFKHS